MTSVRSLLRVLICMAASSGLQADDAPLHLHWADNFLTISGEHLPGGEIQVNYLEAYCRDRSTDADWGGHTYIGHSTELIEASEDGTLIKLRCHVNDGLVVDHEIRSTRDEVDFRIHAHNPTDRRSEAHWAQPCIRLARFTGADQESYLAKSFVFLDGELAMMPTRDWATEARYTPGQVWAAPGVDRRDVNPRPLHPDVPSNGLIGCFSADDSMIFATAFEPYQELFQGVIVCLHSDFRLGGIEAGESLDVRGKIYIMPNDVDSLLERYEADFPEHVAAEAAYAPIRAWDATHKRTIAAWREAGGTYGSLDWDGEFVPEVLMCENVCFQFELDVALGDVPAYEYGPGFGIAMHVGSGTVEAVRRCASLEGLIELKLEGGELTEEAISSIVELTGLNELHLVRTHLPEHAMERLLQLSLLRVLNLRESSIDDAGLEQIGALTELRFLNLDDTHVSDTCLDGISQLPTLYRLSLSGTHISDAGMATISGIESLNWLHLARTALTDAGIAHLSGLRLNTLDLSQTQVTDAGLEHLAGMDNLLNLRLSGLPLAGEGLRFLAPLDRLWSLRLDATAISDQNLQHLAELSSLHWLDISATAVSDVGIQHLAALTTLEHLELTGSHVTADGVERLRRALPHCDIVYVE